MKRIVIDARESGTSTGRYIDKLIEYLHALKPEYSVIILTKGPRIPYMKSIAPTFTTLESSIKEFTFAEQLGLKKQLDNLDADLVHFAMIQQPILYKGKVVTTMHDLTTVRFINRSKNYVIFKAKQLVYTRVTKRVAKKSKAIIVPTTFVKNDVVDYTHIDPSKITVTYEAADKITDVPEEVPGLVNRPFIMYVGRPLEHKNLQRLIEAFTRLQATQSDLKLVLAGKKDASYNQIEQSIKNRRINNVVFTDFVSEGQLRWLYENCRAYVFPSLSEGFGLPGLEAMTHGAAVVSSNGTCLPEVYGQAAEYFDPKDVDNMVEVIRKVITDEALRQRLITAGYAQAAKYSWERMAKQTLEVYRSVLEQK